MTEHEELLSLREAHARLTEELKQAKHEKDEALTCVYEICGCGTSDDGHCMMCCLPITNHRLIPKREIQDIEERLLFYKGKRETHVQELASALARLRAVEQALQEYKDKELQSRVDGDTSSRSTGSTAE